MKPPSSPFGELGQGRHSAGVCLGPLVHTGKVRHAVMSASKTRSTSRTSIAPLGYTREEAGCAETEG